MAAFGLRWEGEEPEAFGLWPDNAWTVEVFVAMSSQWNMGPTGAVGLRYESLPAVMRFTGVPTRGRGEVFRGLRVMERTALEMMRSRSHG